MSCHVEVGDGKGAMVTVMCTDDQEGWVDCSIRNLFWSEQGPSLDRLSLQIRFGDGVVQFARPCVIIMFAKAGWVLQCTTRRPNPMLPEKEDFECLGLNYAWHLQDVPPQRSIPCPNRESVLGCMDTLDYSYTATSGAAHRPPVYPEAI